MRSPACCPGRVVSWLVSALSLIVLGAVAIAAPDRTPAETDALVRATCDRVLQGRFAEAVTVIDSVPPGDLADPRLEELRGWLEKFDQLAKQREASRKKDFDRRVGNATRLLAQIEDAGYVSWIRRVYRTYGTVFYRPDDDASDDDDDDADDARRAAFTTAVDANLHDVRDQARHDRYRQWALADFEQYEDGGLDHLARLARRRTAPGLRGVLVEVYHNQAALLPRLRALAAGGDAHRRIVGDLKRLARTDEDGLSADQHRALIDAGRVLGLFTDARGVLFADLATELAAPNPFRATLGRSVAGFYSHASALGQARHALINTTDERAFRELDWVRALSEDVETEADKHRKDREWVRAVNLYAGLENLHPKEKRYKERRKECLNRARIDRFYTHGSDWAETLKNITPQMAIDALIRVRRHYDLKAGEDAAAQEKKLFKDIARTGLEGLLALVEGKSVDQTFEGLGDELTAETFTRRIRAVIRHINRDTRPARADQDAPFWYVAYVLEINTQTVKLPTEVLIYEFTQSALSPLDRFTSMIWPAEVEEFQKRTMGRFSGVGISIAMQNGKLTVLSPLEDTPAYEAGIAPGDVITHVDGTPPKNIRDAVNRITGPEGEKVVLTISRDGKPRDVELVRARIQIRTVKGDHRQDTGRWDYFLDPENKIAYLRVTSFMERTAADLGDTLQTLADQGTRGLILDLRFNPGGLLRSAVDLSNLFLEANTPVVSTRGRHAPEVNETAKNVPILPDVPLIVLVNDYSASASEIVAGALQDNDNRGLILGGRTFGKGSVQNIFPVGGRSRAYIKLTTARYYLPSGRTVHREEEADTWGVEPDISIKLRPKELEKVIALRRRVDVLRSKKDNEAARDPEKSENDPAAADENKADDLPDVDPQIEAALLVMRARLLGKQEAWPATARADKRPAPTLK